MIRINVDDITKLRVVHFGNAKARKFLQRVAVECTEPGMPSYGAEPYRRLIRLHDANSWICQPERLAVKFVSEPCLKVFGCERDTLGIYFRYRTVSWHKIDERYFPSG